jgi:hypothetical protein
VSRELVTGNGNAHLLLVYLLVLCLLPAALLLALLVFFGVFFGKVLGTWPRAKGRREKKKNGGKKSRIFCDEPRWTCSKKSFFRVFELPLLRNAQKTPLKKIDKK